MSRSVARLSATLAAVLLVGALLPAAEVTIATRDGGWQLLNDCQPFAIKGAGGDASKALLASLGANTCRTWGADNIQDRLDDAQKNGLKVVVGIWLGHERHGFNWSDARQVAKQFAMAKDQVARWKDHPALLAWGLGNEMEGFKDGDNQAIWNGIEAIAKMTKELDPHHPTMTTTAEIGGQRIAMLNRLCPSIDIMGINSYGGAQSLPERYRKAGGNRPYVVTEYGPAGTWEIPKNAFGAVDEPTSTAKGPVYLKTYATLAKDPQCLGSIAFAWGAKIEATATWYGMVLPDESRLQAADDLAAAWGKPVANHCPTIQPLTLSLNSGLKPGDTITATAVIADAEHDAFTTEWILASESQNYDGGGDVQAAPPVYPEAISASTGTTATIKLPDSGGVFRVFAYVRDGKGGAAMANTTLKVEGPILPPKPRKAALPVAIIVDGTDSPWANSGWMGDTGAIGMEAGSTVDPHTGKTCFAVTFSQEKGWGGVVWQSPANDWGSKPGGLNLTGAKRLAFWARGKEGGEKVKIGFGAIGKDQPYHDTAKGETELELTTTWTEYGIDLAGKDLSCIKSGFQWVVGGQGRPVTFYLDDVRWE